jgi:hypothetical protein
VRWLVCAHSGFRLEMVGREATSCSLCAAASLTLTSLAERELGVHSERVCGAARLMPLLPPLRWTAPPHSHMPHDP